MLGWLGLKLGWLGLKLGAQHYLYTNMLVSLMQIAHIGGATPWVQFPGGPTQDPNMFQWNIDLKFAHIRITIKGTI